MRSDFSCNFLLMIWVSVLGNQLLEKESHLVTEKTKQDLNPLLLRSGEAERILKYMSKMIRYYRGGNIPLGAVRPLTEYQAQRDEKSQSNNASDGRENVREKCNRNRNGESLTMRAYAREE